MDDHITAVGAYEAKTRFSELINRAKKGERFLITRNGRPVARIMPVQDFDRAGEASRAGIARSSRQAGCFCSRGSSSAKLGEPQA
jgi:prevent-host-death family protein